MNIVRRKKIIANTFNKIKPLILGFESQESMPTETFILMLKIIFKELENRQNSCHSYALLGWYMYGNFDKFVIEHLENNSQATIIHAWRKYRRGEL